MGQTKGKHLNIFYRDYTDETDRKRMGICDVGSHCTVLGKNCSSAFFNVSIRQIQYWEGLNYHQQPVSTSGA